MKKIMAVVLMGALLLTGCGSSGEDAKKGHEGETLTVLTNSGYPPYEIRNTNGELEGFDIELTETIAKKLGYKDVKWEDIDFDKREICIQRAKDSGTGQVFHEPKTKAGIRYIPIVYDACIERLKAMQTSGKITYINGFVFCTESGKALNYGNIRRAWLKICELAGVNKNIHTFRHTFATAALTKDIPILEVSRCLGHADANTTLKMYGHAMPGFNKHIIDIFQKKKSKSATKTATINQ